MTIAYRMLDDGQLMYKGGTGRWGFREQALWWNAVLDDETIDGPYDELCDLTNATSAGMSQDEIARLVKTLRERPHRFARRVAIVATEFQSWEMAKLRESVGAAVNASIVSFPDLDAAFDWLELRQELRDEILKIQSEIARSATD